MRKTLTAYLDPGNGRVLYLKLDNGKLVAARMGVPTLPTQAGAGTQEVALPTDGGLADRLMRFIDYTTKASPMTWNSWSCFRFVLGLSATMTNTQRGGLTTRAADPTQLEHKAYLIEGYPGTPLLGVTADQVLYYATEGGLRIDTPQRLMSRLSRRDLYEAAL